VVEADRNQTTLQRRVRLTTPLSAVSTYPHDFFCVTVLDTSRPPGSDGYCLSLCDRFVTSG